MVGEAADAALQCSSCHDSSLFYFDCSRWRGHVDHVSVPGVRLRTICVRGDAAEVEVGPVKIGEGRAGTHGQVSRIEAVD
jgi:hypothetical protein